MGDFSDKRIISVVGLGYVGLPLAIEFAKIKKTIAFDINVKRVSELSNHHDKNGELTTDDFKNLQILFTSNIEDLKQANFHIVAVPTPVNDFKTPDLTPVIRATETVGAILKKGDIVIYESTVYPGVTEDICLTLLEKLSGLKNGKDFKIGYSPERINPGDKEHTLCTIKKVVSGQDQESLDIIAHEYQLVIKAGIHKASSIKVAEAAKVIENTQRDVNIALINELAVLFDLMNIDTHEVLEAASTKWNFLNFRPGLVGGHCIGVDPYYLTYKAISMGYHPEVILSGRRINDNMGKFVAQKTIKLLCQNKIDFSNCNITLLGATFKENCSDIRNSLVFDIVKELKQFQVNVQIIDPIADPEEIYEEYSEHLTPYTKLQKAKAIIIAVAHDQFKELSAEKMHELIDEGGVVVDVKGLFNPRAFVGSGLTYWRL